MRISGHKTHKQSETTFESCEAVTALLAIDMKREININTNKVQERKERCVYMFGFYELIKKGMRIRPAVHHKNKFRISQPFTTKFTSGSIHAFRCCMHIYIMCVYMYIYIYIYTHTLYTHTHKFILYTHTHTHTNIGKLRRELSVWSGSPPVAI